jgi:hypothetical protein
MTDPPPGLVDKAQEFGQEMAGLLLAALPRMPERPVEILQSGGRVVIRSPAPDPLPLYAGDQRIAGMKLSVACQMDSAGQYLAVEESTYDLVADVDRTPLLRIHYRRCRPSHQPTSTCTDTVARSRTCCHRPVTSIRTTWPRCTFR